MEDTSESRDDLMGIPATPEHRASWDSLSSKNHHVDNTDVFIHVQIRHEVSTIKGKSGDTVLETARRARLHPPFSCRAGDCGTCKALVEFGSVTMIRNNALSPRKVKNGWVLTCQSIPNGSELKVNYDAVQAPPGLNWLFRKVRSNSTLSAILLRLRSRKRH